MPERAVRSFSAVLCALPAAFASLYLLTGPAFAQAAFLYGLGCALVGAAAGRLFGKKRAALQITASALPAAALAFALDYSVPHAGIARIAAPALGALLAVWAERRYIAPEGLGVAELLMPFAGMLASSAALWLAQAYSGVSGAGAWTVLLAAGSIWLAVAVFALNRVSLRQATRAQKKGDMPQGMRRGGFAGAAVFLVAAFALANANTIARLIGSFFRLLAGWIVAFCEFLSSLFASPEEPLPTSTPNGQMPLPPAQGGGSEFWDTLIWIIAILILAAIAAAAVYGIARAVPRAWRKLMERFRRLFSTWRQEDEGYTDREERLLTLRQAFANAGGRLRELGRVFRRRPRIGDYPTNAGKARFLFREFLRTLISSGKELPKGATATQIARSAPPLAQAYNRARYADEEPTDAEIGRARESMRKKD